MFLLERVTGIDGEHGTHIQILTPFKEFKKPHSIRRVVVPGARMGRSIDERSDGFLPVETISDVIAFEVISTRETQKGRLHVGKFFHQVDSIAVRPIFVRRREERNHVERDRARVRDRKNEVIRGRRLDVAGCERDVVLLPVAADSWRGGSGKCFACLVANDVHGHRSD